MDDVARRARVPQLAGSAGHARVTRRWGPRPIARTPSPTPAVRSARWSEDTCDRRPSRLRASESRGLGEGAGICGASGRRQVGASTPSGPGARAATTTPTARSRRRAHRPRVPAMGPRVSDRSGIPAALMRRTSARPRARGQRAGRASAASRQHADVDARGRRARADMSTPRRPGRCSTWNTDRRFPALVPVASQLVRALCAH